MSAAAVQKRRRTAIPFARRVSALDSSTYLRFVVASGQWAALDGETAKLLLVRWFTTHAHGSDADAVGLRRQAELSGLHINTVSKKCAKLHELGISPMEPQEQTSKHTGKQYRSRTLYRLPIPPVVRETADRIRREAQAEGSLQQKGPSGMSYGNGHPCPTESNTLCSYTLCSKNEQLASACEQESPTKAEGRGPTRANEARELLDLLPSNLLPHSPVPNMQTAATLLTIARGHEPKVTVAQVAECARLAIKGRPQARTWGLPVILFRDAIDFRELLREAAVLEPPLPPLSEERAPFTAEEPNAEACSTSAIENQPSQASQVAEAESPLLQYRAVDPSQPQPITIRKDLAHYGEWMRTRWDALSLHQRKSKSVYHEYQLFCATQNMQTPLPLLREPDRVEPSADPLPPKPLMDRDTWCSTVWTKWPLGKKQKIGPEEAYDRYFADWQTREEAHLAAGHSP